MRGWIGKVIAWLIIFFILYFLYLLHSNPKGWSNFFINGESVEFSALVFLATVAIAFIAYIELSWSNKMMENEFLLNICNKWSSESIIRARYILHDLFVSAYRDEANNKFCKHCRHEIALDYISKSILEMRKKRGKPGEKFINLINLLDFMETVGFFWYRKNIDIKDIDGLFGNSIIFFYQSFLPFIKIRQAREEHYYINFCNLSEQIKKEIKQDSCTCQIIKDM